MTGLHHHLENTLEILTLISKKFQEIDPKNPWRDNNDTLPRKLQVIERYASFLQGYIMMHQKPKSFAGFR